MEQPRTDRLPQHPDEPALSDDATVPFDELAPSMHGATVTLAEFSLTRDQVVELYAAAGIRVERRTVSRYAQEGLLRAEKVDAERGLKRYLFNRSSVEEDIAKRLRGPGSVYAPLGENHHEPDGATVPTTHAPSRHRATTEPHQQAPSLHHDHVHELEIEVATLRGRLTEKDRQHEEDAATVTQLRAENGQLRLGIGEYKGRTIELEKRLALLEAPKAPPPEPEAKPEPPRPGLWHRIFGAS